MPVFLPTARVDPVPFVINTGNSGIGKAAMDSRIIEATVAQRRDLDSERQMKESDDQIQARKVCMIIIHE
jgi:hypothetical protein